VWKRGTAFVTVGARKEAMTVSFCADAPHEEWEPDKMTRLSANRVSHTFCVKEAAAFPALLERMAPAYEKAQPESGRVPREDAPGYTTVDEYIALCPEQIRGVLQAVRRTIREAAPGAVEKIAWGMPTYWQGENLIHFAAAKGHLGIYPGEEGVRAFADRLMDFKTSKGAIRFPYDKPIPYGLIAEMTRFRVRRAGEPKSDE